MIGYFVAMIFWVVSVVVLFVAATWGDPPDSSHPKAAIVSILATAFVPAIVLVRYVKSSVRQEGSLLFVRNPFRSFTYDITQAKGFVDIERPGGTYTAIVPRTGRRPIRIIGLSFPPDLDGIDLGDLPFINIVKRRSYW
jgi:hypothetical protein